MFQNCKLATKNQFLLALLDFFYLIRIIIFNIWYILRHVMMQKSYLFVDNKYRFVNM